MPSARQTSTPGSIFVVLLAVAEQAVLAGVRVDAADADLRVRVAGVDEGLVAAADGALDEAGLDPVDGVDAGRCGWSRG